MPDETTTPAPGSTPTSIDINAITQAAVKAATEAVNAALPGAVNAAIKPITEQVQILQQSLTNAPTTESVSKAVTDAIAAQQAQQAKVSERQKYIAENLKGVPDAYHSHIGDDPDKWNDEVKHLRGVLKGDLEQMGVKADNLGGDAPLNGSGGDAASGGGGKPVTAAIDTSKLSGIELLSMGVQQSSGNVTQPGDSAKTPAPAPGSDTAKSPQADAAK